jgi:acyl-CoA reductase-like NAD-dependent aldehyde dehydrogenase
VRRAKALTHADPLDSATTLGAMVEENDLQRVLGYVDAAVAQGAVAVAGGSRALVETGGDHMGPPVLDGGVPGRGAAQPEIFGPVLVFLPFDTVEEAVTITNGIPFGSAASVWTEDPSTAHLTAKGIRTGTVGSTAMRPQMSRRSGAETEPNCGRRPPSSVRTRSSSSYGWQTRPPCTNGSPRRRSSRRRRPSKPP